MALTHATAVRTTLADAVDALVNTGSGTAVLRLRDSTTVLVSFSLQNPAFGNGSSGTISITGAPLTATIASSGTVDGFQVLDRDGTVIFSGSVTATGGGGDIEMADTTLVVTEAAKLDSFTYNASA